MKFKKNLTKKEFKTAWFVRFGTLDDWEDEGWVCYCPDTGELL